MLTTGFSNAPVTRCLVYAVIATSILASITDTKHYFYIQVDPHLWRYHQFWRILTHQLCYTNSTEVLFAAMSLYNMRVIERLWGSRKFASFVFCSFILTTLITPLLLLTLLRPLSFNNFNYLPAGPTALLFTIIAQYHASIPHIYKYRVSASTTIPTTPTDPFFGLTFSDKSYIYLPAIQLALSQFPGSLLCAVVGWMVGHSWRSEILPGALVRWRVPGWVVGQKRRKRTEDFEEMRRRLETEGGSSTGNEGILAGDTGRRRTLGRQFLDQFGGES